MIKDKRITEPARRAIRDYRSDLTRAPVPVALAGGLAVVSGVWGVRQSLYSDLVWQMKAVQQWLEGNIASPMHFVSPRTDDLSRSEAMWISLWPPAFVLLTLPLLFLGESIGSSVRVVSATFFVIGPVGWARCFRLFSLPTWLVLRGLFPAISYASNAIFLSSAETLLYGSVPGVLTATHSLAEKCRAERSNSCRGENNNSQSAK